MSIQVEPLKISTGYKIETHVYIYLIKRDHQNLLVDTSTHYADHAEQIFQFLETHEVKKLDYLLLTHAHIDHAGNAGLIKNKFPDVSILCSDLAGKRVEKGTNWFKEHAPDQKAVFKAYGKPDISLEKFFNYMGEDRPSLLPQTADILIDQDQEIDGICCYLTPGHAQDHVCYGVGNHFFGGDMVLSYLPGMEGVWTGDLDSFDQYIASAKKLRSVSHLYDNLHHFHGRPLECCLENWYLDIVASKSLKKIEMLLSVLQENPGKPFTLLDLMRILHPKYADHYVYMSQYISILVFLEKQGFVSKVINESGAWLFSASKMDIDFFHRYLS